MISTPIAILLCIVIAVLFLVVATLFFYCRYVTKENSNLYARVQHAEGKTRDLMAERTLLNQTIKTLEATSIARKPPAPPTPPKTREVWEGAGQPKRKSGKSNGNRSQSSEGSNRSGGKTRSNSRNSGRSRSSSDDGGPITGAMIATSVYSGSSYDSSPSHECSPSSSPSCD